jgi:hypothetical protein
MLELLPKSIKCVEVGVLSGIFSEKIFEIINPSELYLIDLFSGSCISGDHNSENIKEYDLDLHYYELKDKYHNNDNVHLIKDFSYNALKKFDNNYLDFIYIDTDHTFDGTFLELELSFHKIKNGGFICGHDYSDNFLMCKNAVNLFCKTYGQKIEVLTVLDGSPSFMIKIKKQHESFEDVLSTIIMNNGLSLTNLTRFKTMKNKIDYVLKNNIDGDIIETGVYKGGMIIFIYKYLQLLSQEIYMKDNTRRYKITKNIIACDSFKGLPEPSELDYTSKGESAKNFDFSYLSYSKSNFIKNLNSFNIKEDEITILEGWFKNTLSDIKNSISILRMDGDYYESTMDTLELLYDKVSYGGVIIIDDYRWWSGCEKAVQDFFKKRNIKVDINYTEGDESEAWFIKK